MQSIVLFKSLRDIAKPQVVSIFNLLKRSTGMSVAEMAKELKMSYMGVKQHCVALEKKGYLDTWRRAKPIGRPEKTYRLTDKARAFFPETGNELTLEILDSIQTLYGTNAPEKLLFNYFNKKTEAYAKRVRGETVSDRVSSFAKIRDQEGYFSEVVEDENGSKHIVEYHNPLEEIASRYPSVQRMEASMFSRLLSSEVEREEEHASGLARYTFSILAS